MKKLVSLFIIVLFAFGCGSDQKRIEKMTDKMISKMNTACQLTPDQESKIRPLVAGYIKTRVELRTKLANKPDSLKKANLANRDNFITNLKTIVTPKQFEKIQEYNRKQKANQQNESNSD